MKTTTLSASLKAALWASLFGAIGNSIWNLILQQVFTYTNLPEGFTFAIIISSFLPVLLSGVIFYLLIRFLPNKGLFIYYALGIAFMVFSNIPAWGSTLPDGKPMPENFALLVVPMHFISGILALYFIPKKSLYGKQ